MPGFCTGGRESESGALLGPGEMNFGEAFHISIDHKLIVVEEYYVGIPYQAFKFHP